MGAVIPLNPHSPHSQTAAPSAAFEPLAADDTVDYIDSAYGAMREKSGLRVRAQQEQLSRAVQDALISQVPLIAEAPTGTGKTIGYLVGALAAYKKTKTPIVVATATVALQEQLLTGDLPRLVSAGVVARNEVVVAKGRGRYLCAKAAEKLNESGVSQLDIFDEAVNEKAQDLEGLEEMLTQFWGGAWDGDIDRWKSKQPVFWARVQANSDTCTKTKCEHYEKCAFFKARNALFGAKVVVANHDLVLADLSQVAHDNEPVLPLEHYAVVFDEAHHLPDKAMEHGRSSCDLETLRNTLLAVPAWTEAVLKMPVVARHLGPNVDTHTLTSTSAACAGATRMEEVAKALPRGEGQFIHQFDDALLPSDVKATAEALYFLVNGVESQLQEALRLIKSEKLAEKLGPAAATLLPLQVSGASLYSTLRDAVQGLRAFLSDEVPVKWMDFAAEATCLVSSPLDGDEVLDGLLWKSKRAVPVMVSATIRDFKGFERFAARIGAPEERKELVVDPVLPYDRAVLQIPFMRYTPRQAERLAYEKELCVKLPAAIDPRAGGALVLVSSWRLMERVKGALREKFGPAVLAQGSLPTKQLVEEHKRRVDAGQPSILVGVASLSEGLDLPGRYCTHVLICAIPFASPVDPVECERSRQAGKEYFAKHSLPDALVKLVQMTGRLIRREDDHGTITVFDMRLRSTGFGRQMLKALPGYKVQALPADESDQAWVEQQKLRRVA